MTINLNPRFFGPPGAGDYAKDMQYCASHNIDTEGKNRAEIKSAMISDMTGMDANVAEKFFTSSGPMDRMKDLMLMSQLGIEPTGNRAGNKAAIVNALSEQKLDITA